MLEEVIVFHLIINIESNFPRDQHIRISLHGERPFFVCFCQKETRLPVYICTCHAVSLLLMSERLVTPKRTIARYLPGSPRSNYLEAMAAKKAKEAQGAKEAEAAKNAEKEAETPEEEREQEATPEKDEADTGEQDGRNTNLKRPAGVAFAKAKAKAKGTAKAKAKGKGKGNLPRSLQDLQRRLQTRLQRRTRLTWKKETEKNKRRKSTKKRRKEKE